MELISSTINYRWKLCTVGSFLGCLILVLFINQNQQIVKISAFRTMVVFYSVEWPDQFNVSSSISSGPAKVYSKASKSSANYTSPQRSSSDSSKQLATTETPVVNYKVPAVEKENNPGRIKQLIKKNNSGDTAETLVPPAAPVIHVAVANPINSGSNSSAAAASSNSGRKTTKLKAPVKTFIRMQKPKESDSLDGDHKKHCNIFDGRWVYKPEASSPYNKTTCPFTEVKMSCRDNGRPDSGYEKWSWQPSDCDIPVFNGTDMLERLRGKRLIMVGDSLNRNQWESLACLLYSCIPSSRAYVDAEGSLYKVFKALDYNCVVEFYWSPFIVKHDENHKSGNRVLVLDKLSESSKHWKGADTMVFNTGHWWIHLGKFRSWDLFQYKNKLIQDMQTEVAYQRGLTTWYNWLKRNVNFNKTTVFFRSISAEHQGKNWCYNKTRPITHIDTAYKQMYPRSMINVVEKKIKEMKNPVRYLNVTKLSKYRIDAHPSVYRTRDKWKLNMTESELRGYSDCSHWCLPGVPDTWNRLLYVSLFSNTSSKFSSL